LLDRATRGGCGERYGRTKIGGRCLNRAAIVGRGGPHGFRLFVDYGYDPDYGNVSGGQPQRASPTTVPPIQKMVFRGYHLAGMDEAFAALLSDLKERGLLERPSSCS
jgi:hypothetical protein